MTKLSSKIAITFANGALLCSPLASLNVEANHVSHKPFKMVAPTVPRKEEFILPELPEEEIRPAEEIKEIYYETEDAGAEAFTEETSNYQIAWEGQKLTPQAGSVYGPSGQEVYYNLDMSGVVAIAHNAGIEGEYWVRDDGVKMLGSYIMCACGFDVRPRGTIVETSLGTGICVDTGTFAYTDPYKIDIAVTW